jgi:membrane protease YdiL (CAAX protease family)
VFRRKEGVMKNQEGERPAQFPFWKQIILHLGPGLAAAGLFVLLATLLPPARFPPLLILQITLPVLILVELGIIMFVGKRQNGTLRLAKLIRFTASVKWWQLILLSAVSIGWVVLVYSTIGDTLNRFMLSTFFDWLPGYFQIGKILQNPTAYTRGIRMSLWILSLIFGSLLGPFVEELYFRGFLLPRMAYMGWAAALVGSLLFVVYHFWTPWLIPLRLLAIAPMVYFVWWKKSIYIGVIAHCTLNLVSDVVLTVPVLLI